MPRIQQSARIHWHSSGFARRLGKIGAERRGMAGNGIVEITDSNFDQDVLKSESLVLVDFWAAWCGPCRAIAPIVDELATQYQGKVKVGKMDVDRNSATPMRYGVRGIPTLLLFKGGQVKEQIVGYVPKETIQKALDKHIG
jgi:thioredoxin 1